MTRDDVFFLFTVAIVLWGIGVFIGCVVGQEIIKAIKGLKS